MGTHSAVAVKRNGKIKSWESTMDGYILVDVFNEWVNGLIKTGKEPFEWVPYIEIGSGSLEIGKEREHDQEYFVGIDYDRKVIYTDFLRISSKRNINNFARRICGLYKLGWRIRYGTDDDCLRGKVPKDCLLMVSPDDDIKRITLTDNDFKDEQKLKKLLTGVIDILNSPTVQLVDQSGQDPSLIINQMVNELRQKLKKGGVYE
jgi:uncharacterized protein YuzE